MANGRYGVCVGQHRAEIFDRGGTRRLGPVLDLAYVKWERARDETSEAMIRVEGTSCSEQKAFLNTIEEHRHELVIFRGARRVWEGPVHRVSDEGTFIEVVARDVSEYLDWQPLTQGYSNAHPAVTTVSGRIEGIIEYELANGRTMHLADGTPVPIPAWEGIDPPINVLPYLQVHHFPNEAQTSAITIPFEMSVLEHLRSLARTSGIDWTVVGRSLHIWDVSRNLGRIRTLTEADFHSHVKITGYGADHTQAAYVISQNGAYGQAISTEWLDYYGPWTQIFTAYQEEGTADPTSAELNSQARRNVSGRSPVPVEVRIPDNSSLILSDTLTIDMLVPGAQAMLRAVLNARSMSQLQKIDHVTVIEEPARETVQITLTPATKPDEDEEEEP